jgi:preprotein translocase subunit SecG
MLPREGIIRVLILRRQHLKTYLDIALIITSVALILSIILQSKGTGIGGLSNVDTGGVFMARRGVEKTLFVITIILGVIFFTLTLVSVYVSAL